MKDRKLKLFKIWISASFFSSHVREMRREKWAITQKVFKWWISFTFHLREVRERKIIH